MAVTLHRAADITNGRKAVRNVNGGFIKAMKLSAKFLRKVKEPTVRSVFAVNFVNKDEQHHSKESANAWK